MKKSIMPYVLRFISSDFLLSTKRKLYAFKRNLMFKNAVLEVFIKADDPYSYLLIQALASVKARFDVKLKFYVFNDIDEQMYPRLEMWNQYANYDAYHLAKLYDFRFPCKENLPKVSADEINILACKLVEIEEDDDFISKANSILTNFWFHTTQTETNNYNREKSFKKLVNNQAVLAEKGHYLGGMIYFEGEWYWGIDRLEHLEKRLIDSGFAYNNHDRVKFNLTYKDFCQTHFDFSSKLKNAQQLTLYWSARSPYSYIGLLRAVKLAKHYNLPLEIKAVLPMMMRKMNVPSTKKMYIFSDTKREAKKLGIEYGFVADPLGTAVERCYSLIEYARSEGKLQDFFLSFAQGVNAEGIRAETDKGLKKIINRCGLDWSVAKKEITKTNWNKEVQSNLDEMFELGCWGVPTITYGKTHFWGQDRFIMLENCIKEDLCSNNLY